MGKTFFKYIYNNWTQLTEIKFPCPLDFPNTHDAKITALYDWSNYMLFQHLI